VRRQDLLHQRYCSARANRAEAARSHSYLRSGQRRPSHQSDVPGAEISLHEVRAGFSADPEQPVINLGNAMLDQRSPVTILASGLRPEHAVPASAFKFDADESLILPTSRNQVAREVAPQRELGGNMSWPTNRTVEKTKVGTKLGVSREEGQKVLSLPMRIGAKKLLELINLPE
jgi:hypothetical protein